MCEPSNDILSVYVTLLMSYNLLTSMYASLLLYIIINSQGVSDHVMEFLADLQFIRDSCKRIKYL